MNESITGLLIALILGALPCILFGYLIAVKQKRGLIAGWNASKVSHPVAFAKLVGYAVLLFGVCLGLSSFAWYLGLLSENEMALLICLLSLIPVVAVITAKIKYRQPSN